MKPFSILLATLLTLNSLQAGGPVGSGATLDPDAVPEGLAKSDWHSIRAAYVAGQHAFHATDKGFQARNPGQRWLTMFDERGFTAQPQGGGWQWGLELLSYGFGENQTSPHGKPELRATGQRLTSKRDETLHEWFVNDQRGLEHGFTLQQRPRAPSSDLQGSAPPNLTLLLKTRGGLRPVVSADALGVLFQDGAGNSVLNYSGLKVWDADGRTLPSRFELAGPDSFRLLVDEVTARYPITIDPIAQQAFLKASNNGGRTQDNFGTSVAVSGDTVVVGAPRENSSTTGVNGAPNDNALDAGAAYVFVRSGSTWSQQAYLKASNTGAEDRFGAAVAVNGDTIVVGAVGEDSSASGVNGTPSDSVFDSGAAYVFIRIGGTWSQQAFLKASNPLPLHNFGTAVAVSGGTIIIGAPFEASSTTGVNGVPSGWTRLSGAAYVFVRSGGTWSQQAYLKASNTMEFAEFGSSVSASGNTVVVGAPKEDSGSTGVNSTPNMSAREAGAAYVFVRSGGIWSQEAYLKASNTGGGARFGTSVAASGDLIVVGSPRESTPPSNSGAAYVFVRSAGIWSQQSFLKASNSGQTDYFGTSVALDGGTLIVGAINEDSSTTGVNSTPNESAVNSGAVYVFVQSGSAWSQQAYLKASNTGRDDLFGGAVAVSGDTIVVGALAEDGSTTGVDSLPDDAAADTGAAYLFVRSGGTWSPDGYLKASNTPSRVTGVGDNFGTSVAVSANTVVVGAPLENSASKGVNSTPDEGASDSGAAYVFVRNSNGTWSQEAYLKASDAGAFGYFGEDVSISGDTIVVGVYREAAYVFVRSGSTWSQQAILIASNPRDFDRFGAAVAVSGDIIVVGAPLENSSTTGVNSTPNLNASNSGAAYVFVRSGGNWTQQAYLKASNTSVDDSFGSEVGLSGETIVVGAIGEDSSTTGVNSTPNEAAAASGAAYVFVRSGGTWSQQAYLKAGNTGAGDFFGDAVAVSGDTIVLGASGEDSSSIGVNSTPDENASKSGAAYVFVRSGGIWSQQAYLKASNAGENDAFGESVAVSNDTIAVGSRAEDSGTTGVNTTPTESVVNSGAAYVFMRRSGTWSQQAYLKANNISSEDYFGYSVAVSGDTIVIGAPFEDSDAAGVNRAANESAPNSGAAYIMFSGASQTISFSQPADRSFNPAANSFTITAPTSSSGLPVTVSVASGPATISGNTVNINGAGIVTLTATQAGDATFVPVTLSRTFTVAKGSQTITFGPLNSRSSTSPPFNLSAAASSGLPVTYSVLFGPAAVSGSIVTLDGSLGYVTLKAIQVGDANWLSATPVQQSFDVTEPSDMQIISFAELPDRVFNPVARTFIVSATASSRLPVTFTVSGPATISGNSVTITGGGDVTVTAVQVGSDSFAPASLARTFTVTKAAQMITFGPLGSRAQDAGSFALLASASSGLPVVFSILGGPATVGGSVVTLTGNLGTVRVLASQPGDAGWNASTPVEQVFNVVESLPVVQQAQAITFNPPASLFLSETSYPLAAFASSALPVTLSLVSGPAGTTLSGSTLTFTAAGTTRIRATQAGNAAFLPAPSVEKSITLRVDPTAMTLVDLAQIYNGHPRPIDVVGAQGAVTITYGATNSPTPPTNAGSYAVKAVSGSVTKSGTLVISKAPLRVVPDDQRKLAGRPNPTLTFRYGGFVASETAISAVSKAPTFSTTASATSPAGNYPITATGGTSANYVFVYVKGNLQVESFAGQYETLLVNDSTLRPEGRLEISIPAASTSYSGRLFLAPDAAPISISGPLVTDPVAETATLLFSVTKGATNPVKISHVVNFSTGLAGVSLSGSAERSIGAPSTSSATWTAVKPRLLPAHTGSPAVTFAGAHTMLLGSPGATAATNLPLPLGSGFATAAIDSKGVMNVSGKLADGTTLTASLRPDSEAAYRLYAQPYTGRPDSYVTGWLELEQHPRLAGRGIIRASDAQSLFWIKAAKTTDANYRLGLPESICSILLDPWLPPVAGTATITAIPLRQRIGLDASTGSMLVQHIGLPSALNATGLPGSLLMSATGAVALSPATAANPRGWRVTVTPTTGAFSGSFTMLDGSRTLTVPISGVMRQPPGTETAPALRGAGHGLLPQYTGQPTPGGSTSFLVEFSRGGGD